MGYKDGPSDRGREIEYMACPLCGRNRVLATADKGRVRWDFFDPETGVLVQVRGAGGKLPAAEQPPDQLKTRGGAAAIGFPIVRGLTWEEARADPAYADQVEAIKAQLSRLMALLSD